MLINLEKVLLEQHKSIDEKVTLDFDSFDTSFGKFPVLKKEPFDLLVEYKEGKKIRIVLAGKLLLEGACNRCLEPAELPFTIDVDKEIAIDDELEANAPEIVREKGYSLDVDKLIYDELLMGWPAKILCQDDCKGICNVCGQNLNTGNCNCEDTSLDPRMAAIRDIFKNFKEV